ncbi:MAG: hypothetical protein [Wendovervirus sonii]|uniref:Uncharacterized protein n=1 Tax=phage Lak_Megaphage_Sonny TaxID=3109229 RepID=A0ABZ0Z2V8_9CAUD|nr:MAG: hypothetical protein [phage Lak_Megaphage_Sonny]
MFEPIEFSQLANFTDGNSIVMLSVLFNEQKEEIDQVDEWFHEIKLIPADSHVTDLRHIVENVLGEDGRSDYLICFSNCVPSPLVRLKYGHDLKWTSDFMDNYREDYK